MFTLHFTLIILLLIECIIIHKTEIEKSGQNRIKMVEMIEIKEIKK